MCTYLITELQKYIKEKLTDLKGNTDKPTIIVGHLNVSLSIIDRTSREKIRNNITFAPEHSNNALP